MQIAPRVYNGDNLPRAVRQTLEVLKSRQVDIRLTRNAPAFRCQDAAAKRVRNGQRGIPLCDELKSLAVSYLEGSGKGPIILCHLAADLRCDFNKVHYLAGALRRPHWLSPSDCMEIGFGVGLVNPFIEGGIHVFDSSLLTRTGTMMTNAGDLTWAVEFNPVALVRNSPNAIIGDITKGTGWAEKSPRSETVEPRNALYAAGMRRVKTRLTQLAIDASLSRPKARLILSQITAGQDDLELMQTHTWPSQSSQQRVWTERTRFRREI